LEATSVRAPRRAFGNGLVIGDGLGALPNSTGSNRARAECATQHPFGRRAIASLIGLVEDLIGHIGCVPDVDSCPRAIAADSRISSGVVDAEVPAQARDPYFPAHARPGSAGHSCFSYRASAQIAVTVTCRSPTSPALWTKALQPLSITLPLLLGSEEKTLTSSGVSMSNPPASTFFPAEQDTLTVVNAPTGTRTCWVFSS
jgi:hypothetical protein